jgi:hypothetical protein
VKTPSASTLALAAFLAVVAGGGCKRLAGGPPPAPAPPDALPEPPLPPPAPPAPLGESLPEEIGAGGDVAVLADPSGVVAMSTDGKRRKVLAAGKVEDVLVDNRSQVIWWKRVIDHRSELVYLDLTGAPADPVLVARARQDWQRVAIGYEQPRELIGDDEAATLLVLGGSEPRFARLGRKCTRPSRDGCLRHDREPCQAGDDDSQCPVFAPGAAERITALVTRGAGRRVYSPLPRRGQLTRMTRVPVPRACPRCGRAGPLPGTKLWAVLVQAVGDFCHIVPQAYDPAQHQFINIQTGARLARPFNDLNAAIGDIWICPSGEAFVGGGTTGTFASGALAPWRGLSSGGCLGGGWFFGGDRLSASCDEETTARAE